MGVSDPVAHYRDLLVQHTGDAATSDPDVLEYILSVLGDFASTSAALNGGGEEGELEEELSEAVGDMLIGCGCEEEAVARLCEALATEMRISHEGSGEAGDGSGRKLSGGAVTLGLAATSNHEVESYTNAGRINAPTYNRADVEKAERKQRAKQEARENKKANQPIVESYLDDAIAGMTTATVSKRNKGQTNSPDIRVENFDIRYGGKNILTNANLYLSAGRRYGLVGRNGIGKSTLLKSMAVRSINIPEHISILYVEQEMEGSDISALESVLDADVERTALLEEEKALLGKEQSKKAGDDGDKRLAEIYARLEEIEADKAESVVSLILAGLGFTEEMQKMPTRAFSGGWRMRLSLARALFCKPDLLLLDEPTNMLDIPAVAWLEDYLVSWPHTVLVVSHDRQFLNEVATDIVHQHNERLDAYKGNFAQFLITKEERLKNQQREYEKQMEYRQHLQDYIDRWRYNAKRAPQAQSKIKILEKLPELVLAVPDPEITFKFPPADYLAPPVIQLDDVHFGYTPEIPLLKGITMSFQMETRMALVGPNGAGKSTLLGLITGKLSPVKGRAKINQKLRIGMFNQHFIDTLDLTMNPVQFIKSKFPGKEDEEVRRNLGAFGITGQLGLQIMKTLSGGQKSRVIFAYIAMQNPQFLILDEPTNHLDMDSIEALRDALVNFKGGVIVVSHDEHFTSTVCNELWLCQDGSVRRLEGGIKEYKKSVVAKKKAM
eukprot:Nk52_evm25s153 gene=Nk52_evmTU25s153